MPSRLRWGVLTAATLAQGVRSEASGRGARGRGPLGDGKAACGLVMALALGCTAVSANGDPGAPAGQIAALLEAGEIRAAADRAHAWAEAQPGDLEALRQCAALSRRIGSYRIAEDALRSLAFLTPNDPWALAGLGQVLIDRGCYEEAREKFHSLIRLDNSSVGGYVGLARLALYHGTDAGEMMSAAQVALSVGPRDPWALTAMGAALNACGRAQEAREYLAQAVSLAPEHGAALFALGLGHAQLGERDQALAQWRRYLEMEPETAQAWLLRKNLVVTRVEPLLDRASYACYSPDGSLIAYRGRGGAGWGIYVAPADHVTRERRIWTTDMSVYSLSWSPDGAYLMTRLYVKTEVEVRGKKEEQWVYRIVVIPTDGKGEARRIMENRWAGEAAWIPGSNHIGVRSFVERQGWAVLDIDPETGDSKQLPGLGARALYYSLAWSPDGSKWAAVRRSDVHPDGSYSYQLVVAPAADLGNARVILETPEYIRAPTFSTDGSVILLPIPAGDAATRYQLWGMPSDGSREPCLIYHGATYGSAPSLSPDGKYLLSYQDQGAVRLTLDGVSQER
jgi:tetratricopeptide (TPR) repeat protein